MQISYIWRFYFDRKNVKILISRRFEIFTKNFHLKLVWTPCTCIIKRKYMSHEITTKGGQVYQIIVNVSCLLRNISHYSMSCGLQWWDVTVFEIPITKVSFYNIVLRIKSFIIIGQRDIWKKSYWFWIFAPKTSCILLILANEMISA